MSVRTLALRWWSKKLKFVLVGGSKEEKNMNFVFSRFKTLFCQSTLTNPTKVAEKLHWGVLQHSTKFQAKIMKGRFYFWRKSAKFWSIFDHNSQPLRLAGQSRSLKIQKSFLIILKHKSSDFPWSFFSQDPKTSQGNQSNQTHTFRHLNFFLKRLTHFLW